MLLSASVLVLAGVAGASVKQGDTELDAYGGFTTQNGASGGADFDAWFLSAGIGYFLTDNVQVQAAAVGVWTSTSVGTTDVDVDVYGLGVRGKYHFMPTNQWVPYVGLQLFWTTVSVDGLGGGSQDVDGIMWGPLVGIRYELNANNDFFAEYEYQIWDSDVGDILEDGHALFVGIVHQFK
jgi:outer membrane protein W